MTTNKTIESIFTCKEHYLAFRAAWAKAVNDKNVEVTGAHHMLYNILRGRAFDKGFTPITRTTKLQNGYRINHGLYIAANELRYPANLLSIFEGTVTKEMLDKLQMPEVKSMDSDYGPYRKVAAFIIDRNNHRDIKPQTFANIEAILEIVQREAA